MRPRADEVLKSIIATFEQYLQPELTTPFAKSLALTTQNLLRHVLLRVEREGAALFEDNRELRTLLAQVDSYLSALPEDQWLESFSAMRTEIKDSLVQQFYGPNDYPSVILLTEEATALRWTLTHAIQTLQNARDPLGKDPQYIEIRQDIRAYLSHQLKREATWIDEAFIGERR